MIKLKFKKTKIKSKNSIRIWLSILIEKFNKNWQLPHILIKNIAMTIYFWIPFCICLWIKLFLSFNHVCLQSNLHLLNNHLCLFLKKIHLNLCINFILMKKNIWSIWNNIKKKYIEKRSCKIRLNLKKKKEMVNMKMLNVKYALTEITPKTILLFFVQCAISVYIKGVLV